MKNISTIIFLFIGTLMLGQEKLNIVSSASIFADMAMNIGGDRITTTSIVPIGGDPHTYEPTPGDAVLVSNADLIFVNGLTFEGWIIELAENSGTKAEMDTITKGVNAISSTKYKNAFDPHAWMDATNGLIYAKNIKDALVRLDPEGETTYVANYEKYCAEIKAVDTYIKEQITKIPEKQRILITSHDAFAYYGKRYGIQLNAIMGISTDAEAQTSDIIRVSKVIKESGVPAVFIESTINPKLLQQIAEDNDVKIGGELYADSIGEKDSPAPTYIKMLTHNTDVIVKALSEEIMSETKVASDDKGNNLMTYLGFGLLLVVALTFVILRMNK